MKRILLGLIAIAMIFAITACSQDQYKQLGEMMGNMSGNIYGIEPNLKDVDAATNKVDNAVAVDGEGNVTDKLEAETAGSIVSSVVAVKNSNSKKEALKTSLSEPLLGKGATDAARLELKTQIAAQATGNKITDEQKASYSTERAAIATAVNDALSAVEDSLSANPTKAELATVAVLTTLAEAVKSGDEETYKEAGKAAVDALKITTEIGQVDVFANVDITSLFNMFNEKGIARDGEEDEMDLFTPLFESSISEIVACITEDGKFAEQRYNKFVMECKALRASYELIAKGYDIDVATPLRAQNLSVDAGLVIEDLGHYIIAVVFSALDSYATGTVGLLEDIIDGYDDTEGYYEQLINGDLDNLPDFFSDDFNDAVYFDTFVNAMAGSDMSEYEFGDAIREIIRDENTVVGSKLSSVLRTIGVILLDSEYEGLLSQIKASGENAPEEGSLRCFLYAF